MTATKYSSQAMGLGQFYDGSIALHGGMRTGKPGSDGTARLAYTVYDGAAIEAGTPAQDAEVGRVEINVVPAVQDSDWRIEGIVSIEIHRRLRGQGLGARVVRAVAGAALDGEVRIYDVKKSAKGFWERLGFTLAREAGRLDGRADADALLAPAMPSPGASPSR